MNRDRARLFTIGERRQNVRQLGVSAMRGDEPLDVVAPARSQMIASVGSRTSAKVTAPPEEGGEGDD